MGQLGAKKRVKSTLNFGVGTPVWAYNGRVPGPEIRLRQGAPLRVEVENRLGQHTTVHWHGLRLRLRLINTANARIFALRLEGHHPVVIALDGQPVAPYPAEGARIVLPPAGRADVILDMAGDPGSRFAVIDDYNRATYRFLDLVYEDGPPLRASPLDAPVALPANPPPEPDLADAKRHEIVLAFVADNPGDWLFHCHILEHMEAGMNAVFRVV